MSAAQPSKPPNLCMIAGLVEDALDELHMSRNHLSMFLDTPENKPKRPMSGCHHLMLGEKSQVSAKPTSN